MLCRCGFHPPGGGPYPPKTYRFTDEAYTKGVEAVRFYRERKRVKVEDLIRYAAIDFC